MLPGRIWYMANVQKRGQVSRRMLAILRLGFVCADRGGQAMWSRPFGATLHSGSIKQLGGASEDARSYWQGRFAACAFVGDVCILVARVRVGALPQTPQGTLSLDPARGRRKGTKSPLDPFRAIELVTLPYFFRVFILLFTLYFNLSANDVAPNRSGSPSHSAHVAPISA